MADSLRRLALEARSALGLEPPDPLAELEYATGPELDELIEIFMRAGVADYPDLPTPARAQFDRVLARINARAAAGEKPPRPEAARLRAEILERDPAAQSVHGSVNRRPQANGPPGDGDEGGAGAQGHRSDLDGTSVQDRTEVQRSVEKAAALEPEPEASAEPEAPPPPPDPGFTWTSAPDSLQWRSRSWRTYEISTEGLLDRTF